MRLTKWTVRKTGMTGNPERIFRIWKARKRFDLKLRKKTSDRTVFYNVIVREQYRDLPVDHPVNIIDAGASIGCTSVCFARFYPDARIIAIEPDRENFDTLLDNIRPCPNIILVKAGLWGKKSGGDMYLKVEDNGRGNRERKTFECTLLEGDGEDNVVRAVTIDEIMSQSGMPYIDISGIDIEGAEKDVFEGDVDSWLPKTGMPGVGLHDRMREGCACAFFAAVARHPILKCPYMTMIGFWKISGLKNRLFKESRFSGAGYRENVLFSGVCFQSNVRFVLFV